MKYYAVYQYNNRLQYCGHEFQALEDNMDINDYNGKYDKVVEVDKDTFNAQQPFYRHTIKAQGNLISRGVK